MLKYIRIIFIGYMVMALSACMQNKVHEIPVSDFFKNPEKTAFKISPDGKYVSYLKSFNHKQNLFIRSLTDEHEIRVTSFSDYSVRGDYFWTFNNGIGFFQDNIGLDELRLYILDIKTLNLRELFALPKGRMGLIGRNKKEPDIVSIRMNKRDPANFDVYRVNIKTGELKPYLINPGNITQWYPDADGRIRLVKQSDGVDETILYRPDDYTPFKRIIENNFKTSVKPIAFTGEGSHFYALSNVNRDKTALVEIDAENGKEVKVIFANDNADLQDADYSKNKKRIELVNWEAAKPQKHYIADDVKQLYNRLSDELKGNEINIADRDTAEDKFIINTYTDRNPGSFYLYESKSKKLSKLGDINSSIKQDELCEMKPVSFKASDGLALTGYLTLPQGAKQTNLPLVVMPHDGPFGHSYWGYNPEVQFLANRGYAVLQVNFRGSTGFGKDFRSAGFKEVGGKIQQDITDGVKWLIANKTANSKKIAIMGGGFGGFSALYGLSFHPELYKCAVVQHGLINFFTYIKDAPPFQKPFVKMMYEMVGNPETEASKLRAISPVFNTDRIKAPLLIFQGAKDDRANITELNQFVRELQKQNGNDMVKYFLKPNERTNFRNENNRLEMYTEIEKFLDKNMRVKP